MDDTRWALPRSFYAGAATEVAPSLLGALLCRETDAGILTGIITEVEAYRGHLDDASHAYRGPTPRTRVMFGEPGHTYVYLIYGMWNCMNVVCGEQGTAEAVLVRAIRPVQGTEQMRNNRGGRKALADGPGKLCQALDIDRDLNGADLGARPLWISPGLEPPPYVTTPRIGIDYAQKSRNELWRYVADEKAIEESIEETGLKASGGPS